MSLYADYLKERTGDRIIEDADGFVTYRYINERKSVYIIDIYIVPEARKTGVATFLADQVCKEAKANGCKELLGTVVPSAKGSNSSLRVLWGYGMTLHTASENLIIMRKDL